MKPLTSTEEPFLQLSKKNPLKMQTAEHFLKIVFENRVFPSAIIW